MTDHLSDYTADERQLFNALPRASAANAAVEERIVAQLRDEGLLRTRARRFRAPIFMAIAAGLIVGAWMGGARYGASAVRAASIEGQLERTDLSSADRILLMQRAGSAYVAAANGYAASVKRTDSTAVEVSSQVLMGAARAVARTGLDGTLEPRLASVLGDLKSRAANHSVIWY